MSNRSAIVGFVLLGMAVTSALRAEALTVQGTVTGPDGKALSGAEVRAERADQKGTVESSKTDNKGHYAFRALARGTYKITAVSNQGTSSTAVKTRADGAVRVDFEIKPSQANAKFATKKRRMVWVPSTTGSNIGAGGRWVEADDDSNTTADADRVDHVGADSVRKLQGTMHNPAGGR